ncbi:hypothetical protein NCU07581 [Neurospora crassa OR74A]|uniref:Uncharacterized protein n=1 Tax=Neurospora crassa (strain ATCC 24698 / 74-OR23-1A / CBS 708.71 / DSM 1257 / FGSC 987) TaxID=367110 RepID=Q7SBH5_NEUCR|nr:hypothetical protein NCU07581 [Neurospora crassa OR74A]EAA33725.1 hypothetical protein NCU07581 [Neurospora crassa OR74A]|eukprot:XP_962961.1 hypothetical protein NCU07581 [Neurospora crassa OR74A]
MKFQASLILALQVLSVAALPHPKREAAEAAASSTAVASATASGAASATATTAAQATATAGAGTGDKKGEEEDENEVEQAGKFNTVIKLGGGDVKTDTQFPAGTVGAFEVEFKNPDARQLRVTENKTPAAAPPGFKALEPVSYKVEIGGGASKGLTLSKIDFIRNANSTVDISQAKLGKLCKETNSFVIGDGVGETEFEADENEVATKVPDLVGEYALFVPDGTAAATPAAPAGDNKDVATPAAPAAPAAGAGDAAGGAAGGGVAAGCGPGTICRTLVDGLLSLIEGAAAGAQTGKA